MLLVRFDIQKKIQAASVIVRLEGGRVDRVRLLKLLYLADRSALAERAIPIVGGRVDALDNGPLHSEIYNLIKSEDPNSGEWKDVFENDGHSVVLKSPPECLDISEYETDKLTETFERYKHLDTWSLVELTHELPEWKKFHRLGSSQTIPSEAILKTIGYSPEMTSEILSEAESFNHR